MSCTDAEDSQWELVNIEDILSQEVPTNLQMKEEKREEIDTAEVNDVDDVPSKVSEGVTDDDVANDVMLAKLLQMQFDEEYVLNRTSGYSKVSISSGIYHEAPSNYNVKSDLQEEETLNIEDGDTFDYLEKELACLQPKREKKAKTKQDVRADTYKLSSKVFNSLEPRSYTEEFCKYKAYCDTRKRPMYKLFGIDECAWRLIRKMTKDQIIKEVTDIISIDEEAVILRALMHRHRPIECSIKVFKAISIPYEEALIVACQKAEKEAANYARLKAVGIRCLDIIALREHVLVLAYLGPPPLSEEDLNYFTFRLHFNNVKNMMKKMFVDANLIHANLSERNIVWYGSETYFINFSQSVDSSHEKAFKFLFRDCTNVIDIFRRRGYLFYLNENPDRLFKYITGYSFCDKRSLSKLQKTIRTNVSKKGKDKTV